MLTPFEVEAKDLAQLEGGQWTTTSSTLPLGEYFMNIILNGLAENTQKYNFGTSAEE
jgi:hypothetical protein